MADGIYSATYSNVPVYEFTAEPGVHVMRRRGDDWINATHILKAAKYEKSIRTRILEREVQKGVHEKVQGGYGKYQGTWIPLPDGRALALKNGVLDKLRPIFDFVPGDRSPPPAPKHSTAASRPRAARASNAKRAVAPQMSQVVEEQMETASIANHIDESTPDNASITESRLEDETYSSQYTNPRKRKREDERMDEIWADALLDYFMLADSEQRLPAPPSPPPGIDLDRPIDDKGHTALHWAAAMGDVDIVKDLLNRGAHVDVLSKSMETPLMRAVMFTNNYDRSSMGKLVRLLHSTVQNVDWFGSTVFHHIAATTSSKNKYLPARYYLDTVINALAETWVPADITRLLNARDNNGDTAIHIAARHGARKCVRSLLGRSVAVDVPNGRGETADEMIQELNARRLRHAGGRGRDASSSPFGPDRVPLNGHGEMLSGAGAQHPPPTSGSMVAGPPEYLSQTASALMARVAPAFMAKCRGLAAAFESEYLDKQAEARAGEAAARKRVAEVDVLRRTAAELQAAMDVMVRGNGAEDGRPAGAGAEDEERERAREEAECEALEREALSLLELEQRETLRASMAKLTTGPAGQNGAEGRPEESAAGKMRAAQSERQRLTRDIVRSLGVAGLGERHAEYKRLIHGALNVKEDALEEALDEILGQLEEERRERMLLEV